MYAHPVWTSVLCFQNKYDTMGNMIRGTELLGVVISFAKRKSDRFKSDVLHHIKESLCLVNGYPESHFL